jgi:hypothetical protein
MYTHFRYFAVSTTALLTFALVANLVPLMAVPTVLPEIQSAWGLMGHQTIRSGAAAELQAISARVGVKIAF